jgi:hypothetical protein
LFAATNDFSWWEMQAQIFLSKILFVTLGLAIATQESSKLASVPRSTVCDDSCQSFRKVLKARAQQFRTLRGAQTERNRWQAKVIIPALSAGVCEVAEEAALMQGMERWGTYYCQLPRAARESANREFNSVLPSLKASLPKEWHTELFENSDEKTQIFRAGPSSDELYLVLACHSDDRGYSLTFQASSIPIPID